MKGPRGEQGRTALEMATSGTSFCLLYSTSATLHASVIHGAVSAARADDGKLSRSCRRYSSSGKVGFLRERGLKSGSLREATPATKNALVVGFPGGHVGDDETLKVFELVRAVLERGHQARLDVFEERIGDVSRLGHHNQRLRDARRF